MRISKAILALMVVLGGLFLLAIAQAKQDNGPYPKYISANAVIIEDEE